MYKLYHKKCNTLFYRRFLKTFLYYNNIGYTVEKFSFFEKCEWVLHTGRFLRERSWRAKRTPGGDA